ncbi:MAG: phospho-N-acetylmuramoyl-pentapeptide-transferase [Deltaproteobacteria bacterium]
MLYFLYLLRDEFIFLNIFKYITFRSFGAGITAFVVSIFLGRRFIEFLRERQFGEKIRGDGPDRHKAKAGTPTMGGVFIVASIALSTFLWANLGSVSVWFVLLFTVGYGMIGFRDDWLKLSRGKGMTARSKFLLQLGLGAVIVGMMLLEKKGFTMSTRIDEISYYPFTSVILPFVKRAVLDFGWLYVLFAILVVAGSSNAVNLTDGLDGLAIGSITVSAATYIVFAYLSGHAEFSRYLQIPYIADGGELAVFLSAVAGAALGFLWYNSHPAEVFMGDVGSLALGAAIGSVAIMIKQEVLLVLVGGLFVMEAVSVIIQVVSFKLTKKRVFRMAPLHHHFELSGWAESKVVIRFWIVSLLLSIAALSTLKLR